MNILYIAYSCAPNSGSENKIGWRVPLEAAENHRVFVVTKEEHRAAIEEYQKKCGNYRVSYHFVDIPAVYKRLFKGPLYSGRLNIWHRKALPLVKQLCKEQQIDVIHQITPVEFRSIGRYGSIPGIKFICGPLGGGEQTPKGLRGYMQKSAAERIRVWMNRWYRFRYGLGDFWKHCHCVMFANEETKAFLKERLPVSAAHVQTEIAVDLPEALPKAEKGSVCTFLVAGRMIPRKGHRFLLDALEQLPSDLAYTCRIVGGGPELEGLKARVQGSALADHVTFVGKISHEQMAAEYASADVLVMPSLRETTGSVLLEAMSHGLPAVTIGRFGGAVLLDSESGWLYDGQTKDDYIQNLKEILQTCIERPEEIRRKAAKAKEIAKQHSWKAMADQYCGFYQSLCGLPKE